MKNIAFLFLWIMTLLSNPIKAQETPYDKVFFSNSQMEGNYYYSNAHYTSPSWVQQQEGKLTVNPDNFTPGNSLDLAYTSSEGGTWEARINYHKIRGIDHFTPAARLSLWIKVISKTAPEELPLIQLNIEGIEDIKTLPLSNYIEAIEQGKWIQISISLDDFISPMPETEKIQAVIFRQGKEDGKSHHLLLDQVELLPKGSSSPLLSAPKLLDAKGYARHVDIQWNPAQDPQVKYVKIYRSVDKENFEPVGIQIPQISRFSDYVGPSEKNYTYKITLLDKQYRESGYSEILTTNTRYMNDEQLLDMVQEANFRYYWEGAEPESGLALENIPGRRNMIASGASGFGIMALLVGIERGFISREQGVERFLKITDFLHKAETFHGAFSHFIDGPTGKVEPFFGSRDNGGDLVETSFLLQGLLTAKQYFDQNSPAENQIREKIQKIWENVEWSWYKRYEDNPYLLWHWSPDKEWVINHKLIGWNETMITYLLAIASTTHGVPASMYYSGWASQSEEAKNYRTNWGKTADGSNYSNGKTYYGIPLPVGVSTGGPLFFIHYSYLGLNPHRVQDKYTDYFTNNRNIALINYRYCLENPNGYFGYGKGNWGLTASDGPKGYSANEPAPHADKGKMTPTGALASFPYTPEQSMEALKNYYYNHGKFLWGEYGFRDAFDLNKNWCSELYMGLNQAPIVVMIENYRSGLIWDLFMQNEEIMEAVEKIKNDH